MRTVPHCHPTGRAGMPQMPKSDRTDCRHGHGAHAVVHLVLGRLPGRQPDPRHVGRPVPAATRALALRDSLSDPPQTARRNGPPRSGSHRWPRERACRGGAGLRKRGYDHHAIAECGDPEMTEEFLPIIHLAFANLKTWLTGTQHGVSAQHLQAYLNEFTFRFNRRFYPFNAFRSLLGIAGDVKAPTYAELYSGHWTHPTCSGCMS